MRRMTFTPALVLVLGLSLSIGACGDDDAAPTDNGDTTEASDTTEPAGDDDATEPAGDDDATEPAGDDAGPSDDDATEPAGDDDATEPVEDDTTEPADDAGPDGPGNIIEVAGAAGDFSLLAAAVEAAGLTETLSTGEYTVFAPTDAAITAALEALNLTVEEFVGNSELLTSVLTYHVVAGTVLAADVVTMTSATTLQGADITIEVIDEAVVLNGSVNVVTTDIMASNGVIHVIDGVLLPPADPPASTFCEDYVATCGDWPVAETSCADWWAAAAEGTEGDSTGATQACYTYHLDVAANMTEQADIDMHCAHALGMEDMNGYAPCTNNLIQVAEAAGFNLLTAAVGAAGLTETLSTGGPYTIFAPTDEAITAALEALNLTVEEFVGNTELLNSVLTYHVVEGEVLAADVVTMSSATTLGGADISIEVDADGVVVLNGSVNVTATDVMASNGVIHIIDGVLLPPSDG